MAKFAVYIGSTASARVVVEFEDSQVADHFQFPIDEIDDDNRKEYASHLALEDSPELCGMCSGWGNEELILEIVDTWTVEEDAEGNECIERLN